VNTAITAVSSRKGLDKALRHVNNAYRRVGILTRRAERKPSPDSGFRKPMAWRRTVKKLLGIASAAFVVAAVAATQAPALLFWIWWWK
jgi:hypothetical protein